MKQIKRILIGSALSAVCLLSACGGYSDKEKAYYRNGYKFEKSSSYVSITSGAVNENNAWYLYKNQVLGVEDEPQYERAFIEGFNDALDGKKCKY